MRLSKKMISGVLALVLFGGFFAPAREARAAVAFGAVGTAGVGVNAVAVPYPTGVAAGNLLVLSLVTRYETGTPTLPSGWQQVTDGQWTGGLGSNTNDSGQAIATTFVRVADGTESGSVTINIPVDNCIVGTISRFTKSASAYWDVAATKGTDNIAGTAHTEWSVTGAANPGITSGDMIITTTGVNASAFTFSTRSLAATSATIGSHTQRVASSTGSGGNCMLVVTTHAATAGTASAAPVFTMTSVGTETTVAPTGASIILRIREVSTPSTETTITSAVSVTGGISVLGALAKGAGTFVIDHPLDPVNKLLYHSFVESPDVKNLYDGIATLNGSGEATIELPSYFLALNRSYRYLATPVGEPMPELHLAQEVEPKWFGWFGTPAFKISGGTPWGRISWQVSGVRQDPFILANPIVPEVPKGPDEIADVGEYICPECYE